MRSLAAVVTAFCATRPPGHHAGTELRAMSAPSNGFCVFNSAAAAAKYAVASKDLGGLGLARVAVIDFDVHHGNGTQVRPERSEGVGRSDVVL